MISIKARVLRKHLKEEDLYIGKEVQVLRALVTFRKASRYVGTGTVFTVRSYSQMRTWENAKGMLVHLSAEGEQPLTAKLSQLGDA